MSFTVKKGELVLITGASGCGKTTLLRMFKPAISPSGKTTGEVRILGSPLTSESDSPAVGYVSQHPERCLITDTVTGELAFAPENMGLSPEEVQLRISETATYFGIGRLFDRELSTLSGGELKMVSLCAVMTMHPEILLLDEPVSRLDPVTAESFMSAVLRLNRELGITVIIAEHRTEGFFAACDKILPMKAGTVLGEFSPAEAAEFMLRDSELFAFLPCAARITRTPALTVKAGREYLQDSGICAEVPPEPSPAETETVLECRDLCFAYSRTSPDILTGTDLSLKKGEAFTVLGANGSGKTTLLKVLSGLLKPYNGRLRVLGKKISAYKNGSLYRSCIALLPQDSADIFTEPTVYEDYSAALSALGEDLDEAEKMLEKLSVSHLKDTHPLDLSGGELQLCALGRLLFTRPKILLLDEPTKGLDPVSVRRLTNILTELKNQGTSLLTVTHDLEFAAEISDRCGLFFAGQITALTPPQYFFTRTRLYTTPAVRICRNFISGAYKPSQAENIIKSKIP